MRDTITIIISLTLVVIVLFTQAGFGVTLDITTEALDALVSAAKNFSH